MKRFSLTLLLFLAVLSSFLLMARPGLTQATNLLQNPGFEQPYNSDGSAGSWSRWHEDTGKLTCDVRYTVLPHWSAEANSDLRNDGSSSQAVGNMWDPWHGGVMQTVSVTPGARYRFSFWARGRAASTDYPEPSDTSINMGIRAGIDPNGSGLWYDSDVAWGGSGSVHYPAGWQQFTTEATATGDKITVFASADYSSFPCRASHYDMWFDTAELILTTPPTNTPLPPPPPTNTRPPATNTPIPSATAIPTETVIPTETPIPTDTPTSTPEPPKGGAVCINAFADSNANGQHEATEGYMAGVSFTVTSSSGEVAGQGVAPGTNNPVCLEGLPPGDYRVTQIVPAALDMTTAADITIPVVEGQTVGLEFGSRIRPPATATATPGAEAVAGGETPAAPATDPSEAAAGGLDLLAVSGLVIMLLAVILLGVLIFVLLRRQTR